jgi:hypothetical protein
MSNQEIDLQKIQVIESSYERWFNFKVSILAGGLIGILIFVATMQYEKIINIYGLVISELIIIPFAFYFIWDLKQNHEKHDGFINNLIQKVENGEKLDPIEELRQKHKDSTKIRKSNASHGKL